MKYLAALLDRIDHVTLLILCLTLGLAPFFPEPHIWEKLKMLMRGALVKPLDIFDLMFHGLPWLALMAKLVLNQKRKS